MAEGLILKSASFEKGGDEAREEHLEAVMENAGFEVVEPEASGPEGEAATPVETLPPRKSRKERAIERATAPLREKIKQLETGSGTVRPTEAEAVAAKPQRADFANDEAFEDALVAWGTRNALTRQRDTELLQNYAAQVREAKEQYPDWEKVVNQDIHIGQAAQVAIIRRPNSAEVTYYLGKHPAYAAKLGEMDPADAFMEIGILSARLAGTSSGEEYERRPRPKVPAPVRTVSTGGSTAAPRFADIAARPNYPGKARDLKRALAED